MSYLKSYIITYAYYPILLYFTYISLPCSYSPAIVFVQSCLGLGIRHTGIQEKPNFWSFLHGYSMYWSPYMANYRPCTIIVCLRNAIGPKMSSTDFNVRVYYIPLFLVVIFFVFAIFAYGLMFYKFISSRRKTRRPQPNENTIRHAFRHSKFFVSIMLITSFLILMVIPFSAITLLMKKKLVTEYKKHMDFSVLLSDTMDGLIYVFLIPSVRKLFWKKLSSVYREKESTKSNAVMQTTL